MKDDNYRCLQMEGYDNPRMKFITTSVNNHIGSDIQVQSGKYDQQKQEFTYEWESQLIKGQIKKNGRIIKVVDSTHYLENY